MKNTCYTLSEQYQNPNEKSLKESKSISLTNKIHDCSLSLLGTGISMKNGGVRLATYSYYISQQCSVAFKTILLLS